MDKLPKWIVQILNIFVRTGGKTTSIDEYTKTIYGTLS